MDFNQQLELELNQPVQNRDGSRRCHSRLAEALVYVTSHPERAALADVSSRSEPEQAASVESADSLRRTVSDIDTVARLDFKRTYSETAKIHLPTSYSLDKIPVIGSVLASPEPYLITMSYRIKDSPPPSTVSPLPHITFSQHDQELKLQQPPLDNIKKKKKFEYFEIGREVSDIQPKQRGMQNNKPEHEPKVQQQQLARNNKRKFQYFEIGLEESDIEPKTPEKKEQKKFQYFEIGMEHVEPKSLEKEIQAEQQQLDSNKNTNKFEYFEIGLEARDTDPKTPKKKFLEIGIETRYIEPKPLEKETEFHDDVQIQEGDIEQNNTKDLEVEQKKEKKITDTESVDRVLDPLIPNYVQKEASNELETDFQDTEKVTQTLTKVKKKLNDLLGMSKKNIQVHPPRCPKPPKGSKGQIIVRGTKASRLRQSILQEKNEKSYVKQDVLTPFTAEAAERRTIKQSMPLKSLSSSPSTAKKNTVPLPVLVVRETKASKLRRLKKMEDEREARRKNEEEKLKDFAFDHPLKDVLQRKRTPKPTFQPAPPKPYKRSEPVVIKETRASKLRKIQENAKKMGNTVFVKEINSQGRSQKQTLQTDVKENLASRSHQVRSPTPTLKPAPQKSYKKPGPVVVKDTRASKLLKVPDNIKKTDNKEGLPVKSIKTSDEPPTERVIMKQPQGKPPTDDKALGSPKIREKEQIKHELARSETPMACLLPPIYQNRTNSITEDEKDATPAILKELRESRYLERSEKDRMCRIEVSRGFKVRKEIRLTMDEEGKKWESNIKIPVETYRVQRSVDSNKQMVQEELNGLRERLRQAEVVPVETGTSQSKDKSFFGSKFKTYFKGKKAADDEKNLKKERKDIKDEYFRKTEEEFCRQLSHDWVTFLLQQNCHHEMLKKARLQKEMIYQWKSQAIHYKILHTMLEKDLKEGREESWYL